MILAWGIWPFIVVLTVLLRALWRVLRRWYLPVGAGVATYPIVFVTMFLMIAKPQPEDAQTELWQFHQIVRWWDRWSFFGVARLFSDQWTVLQQPAPTGNQMRHGMFYTPLAASLTVASLIFGLVFLWMVVQTIRAITPRFEGGFR